MCPVSSINMEDSSSVVSLFPTDYRTPKGIVVEEKKTMRKVIRERRTYRASKISRRLVKKFKRYRHDYETITINKNQ